MSRLGIMLRHCELLACCLHSPLPMGCIHQAHLVGLFGGCFRKKNDQYRQQHLKRTMSVGDSADSLQQFTLTWAKHKKKERCSSEQLHSGVLNPQQAVQSRVFEDFEIL
jgi:hypothetical protein